MHEKTNSLIENLKALKSKDEILSAVVKEHEGVKSALESLGVKFYEKGANFSESIIGGQIISGEKNVYRT